MQIDRTVETIWLYFRTNLPPPLMSVLLRVRNGRIVLYVCVKERKGENESELGRSVMHVMTNEEEVLCLGNLGPGCPYLAAALLSFCHIKVILSHVCSI